MALIDGSISIMKFKFQVAGTQLQRILGLVLQSIPMISQLFVKRISNGTIIMLTRNIVDDIQICGQSEMMRDFIYGFNEKYGLCKIVNGTRVIIFSGVNIRKDEDFSVSIHVDKKRSALEPYPIRRMPRREPSAQINEIETEAYMSLNASFLWLGITFYPMCSLYVSLLQPKKCQK